jgi:hypothetical protein
MFEHAPSDADADTFECRWKHLNNIPGEPADTHCSHAGPTGGGVCD